MPIKLLDSYNIENSCWWFSIPWMGKANSTGMILVLVAA